MNADINFIELDIYTSTGRDEFKSLHNTLFPNTDISLSWIEWYMLTAAQTVRVYGAWDGPDMVGMWCVETKLFKYSDGTMGPVGRCFAVGIHPDYRRRNLFVELSEFAIRSERKLGLLDYVIGFPQVGKPVVNAHLKAGWERVQHIEMYSYRPQKDAPKVSISDVNVVKDFTNYYSARPVHPGSFNESATYKNLRWKDSTDNFYICLEFDSSYVVLKPYGGICHVLDIGGERPYVERLLRAATTLAYRHKWSELTVWCTNNEAYRDSIESVGFQLGSQSGLSIDMLAVRINAVAPLKLDRCHFQMGSEEIY